MKRIATAALLLALLASPAYAANYLIDGFGNIWAFDNTAGGIVYENGIQVSISDVITSMEYKNGSIYAHGTSWWRFTNGAFSASGAP